MADTSTDDTASSSAASNGNNSQHPKSLSESLELAAGLISDDKPNEAVPLLTSLQQRIAASALFSSNESLEDVPTSSLPLLATEFHLASAILALRTSSATERRANVVRSSELFHAFIKKLDDLGRDDLLGPDLARDYRQALDDDNEEEEHDGNGTKSNGGLHRLRRAVPENRDTKIARFRARKAAEEERNRLRALRERRERLGLSDGEELDGNDMEGVERALSLADLRGMVAGALDEVRSGARELEILDVAIKMGGMRADGDERRSHPPAGTGGGGHPHAVAVMRGPPPNGRGMQVTRVTQDPTTGQLQFRREELRSQVFRPAWNQPTMTLAEFGDMEVARAMEREARQKAAEEEDKTKPRRYEQLVRDGMEDDSNLVDASAKLDREWDDWKDENPRGGGNKMGDRGDRNF